MNKLILFFLLFASVIAFGQSPQGFKYQAVVRNASGVLVYNQIISIKSSILKDSPTGATIYSETQTLSTSENGVVAINIGEGTVVAGVFSSIDWSASTYFIKTELDLNGGSNFQFMGTTQILSVPYALFSEKSKIAITDHDTIPTNELQNLSVSGHNLSISNGNTIVLPPDNDSDPTNENQTLQIVGDSLKITNGNAVLLTGSVDLDASPVNELQSLSLNGNQLSISNGNTINLPPDNDSNPSNEIQNLGIVQGTISITNANQIHLPDSSATNEIQTLTRVGTTLSISNGNSVTIPDISTTNELQTLSIIGDSLHISSGNAVKIVTAEHYVGELWGGGIICYLWKDVQNIQHGLIASIDIDQSSFSPYSSADIFCTNYSSTDLSGTYTDWYLPSTLELKTILRVVPSFSLFNTSLDFSNYYLTNDSSTTVYGFDQSNWNIKFASINNGNSYRFIAVRTF